MFSILLLLSVEIYLFVFQCILCIKEIGVSSMEILYDSLTCKIIFTMKIDYCCILLTLVRVKSITNSSLFQYHFKQQYIAHLEYDQVYDLNCFEIYLIRTKCYNKFLNHHMIPYFHLLLVNSTLARNCF